MSTKTQSFFLGFLIACGTAEISVANPIHLEVHGTVNEVSARGNFQLPASIVPETPAVLSLAFDRVVLAAPGGDTSGDTEMLSLFAGALPRATSELVGIHGSFIRIGPESLSIDTGRLFVSDNKTGGVCAGFHCSTWADDEIDILTAGDASVFGPEVTFSTSGGFISRADERDPPSEVLAIDSDIGDQNTWNRFERGLLHLSLSGPDGERLGRISIDLLRTVAVPEPSGLAHLALVGWLVRTRRRFA